LVVVFRGWCSWVDALKASRDGASTTGSDRVFQMV
jgi:hypothetical protein